MEVTDVRIHLRHGEPKVKAYAKIVLDNCFVVNGLKVISGAKGFFVAMPSRLVRDRYQDVAHPTNNKTRMMIEDAVIEAYEQCIK